MSNVPPTAGQKCQLRATSSVYRLPRARATHLCGSSVIKWSYGEPVGIGNQMEENKRVVLKCYIDRMPLESDLEVKVGGKMKLEAPPGSGALVVKNLYLSCDPYMRGRMRDFHGSYVPPFVLGEAIRGFGVSKVVHSDDPKFEPGDIVCGITGWEEFSLIEGTDDLRKITQFDLPLSYHVGLLGMPGFTAYAGFYEVCSPKKREYVFISAASGAVGQVVGQLAKLHGCYVVGSTGSGEKVDILKNKLGFDKAFNYKEEKDLDAALKRYFPNGIDIYFDNVGGPMLDAVLLNMRVLGRIAVCGMISQNSFSSREGIHNLYTLIPKRVTMKGFLQSDYVRLFPQFLEHITSNFKQGKIVYIEDMKHGLDNAPATFARLFDGKNVGKQRAWMSMLRVSGGAARRPKI